MHNKMDTFEYKCKYIHHSCTEFIHLFKNVDSVISFIHIHINTSILTYMHAYMHVYAYKHP